MKEYTLKNRKILVDNEGFLVEMNDWDEEVARELATLEGIEDLSAGKLRIVKFMRKYFEKFHAFPILKYVCKGVHGPRDCVVDEFVNPMKAWKIAGLPHPSGIHFVTLDGEHYKLEECC